MHHRHPIVAPLAAAQVVLVHGCDCLIPHGPSAELAANRAKWRSANLQSYEFTYGQECFCPPEILREVIVTVTDGAVSATRYADDNSPADPKLGMTVDDFFDMIAAGIARHAAQVSVQYDPDFGYPAGIFNDPSTMIADDEWVYVLHDLRP